MLVPLIVVVVLLVVIGGYLATTYNKLVGLRNRVETAWSQIDVQLKRRYDLIPNLVETVRGYASHERETLEGVIQARQQAIAAPNVEQRAQAENALTGMLRQLFALSEAYPDLKANQSFLSLQTELTQTEEQIAFARRYYNERVLSYDNSIEMFPSNIIAGMFGFQPKPYFEAETESREPVQVDFGTRE
ncbi:MAG: LemA family protein [Chloroflexi bacterium]|nr:LemA family protein [Chloroflexota bacterium]MDA1147279.1 LemA family protein [Chloroflexota bacterium]